MSEEASHGIDHGALARVFGLLGKVALVTDNGGLGHAEVIALLLEAGATVVSADVRPVGYDRVMKQPGMTGRPLSYAPMDIGDENSIIQAFDDVVAKHGRIDIVINAGGLYTNTLLADMSVDDWRQVQALSLTSNFMLMREAVRHMVAGKIEGRIVNLTSIGSRQTVQHGNGAYGAARAGVTMLGRTTAYDYAPHGIRVNTVLVGAIEGHVRNLKTERTLAAGGVPTPGKIAPDRLPLGRGTGADVAAAVLYLVGPSGAYISGQELAVDGGYSVS